MTQTDEHYQVILEPTVAPKVDDTSKLSAKKPLVEYTISSHAKGYSGFISNEDYSIPHLKKEARKDDSVLKPEVSVDGSSKSKELHKPKPFKKVTVPKRSQFYNSVNSSSKSIQDTSDNMRPFRESFKKQVVQTPKTTMLENLEVRDENTDSDINEQFIETEPPQDGVYSLAENFLNGSLLACMDLQNTPDISLNSTQPIDLINLNISI
jgi:hypothetical protein